MSEEQTPFLNGGGPAFPPHGAAFDYEGVQTGMTLRDYFAAKAMQGILAHEGWSNSIAEAAYQLADDMLDARGGAA